MQVNSPACHYLMQEPSGVVPHALDLYGGVLGNLHSYRKTLSILYVWRYAFDLVFMWLILQGSIVHFGVKTRLLLFLKKIKKGDRSFVVCCLV